LIAFRKHFGFGFKLGLLLLLSPQRLALASVLGIAHWAASSGEMLAGATLVGLLAIVARLGFAQKADGF
jgi:hypothetical protein